MSIVAKKRGGSLPKETRWKRVVPLAVLLALAAVVAWRFAGGSRFRATGAGSVDAASEEGAAGRPENAPYHEGAAEARKRVPPGASAGETPASPEPPPTEEHAASRAEGASGLADETPALQEPPPPPAPPKREKPKRTYPTIAESVISGFANTRPGYPPPAMLRLPTAESIEEILDTPIEIAEDDDETTVALKENCARMKEEMKAYIADGGTAENFLLWYHNELTKDYNDWRASQQRIVQLLKDGELEEAERFAEEANADFAARGIRSVMLPQRLVERITGQ